MLYGKMEELAPFVFTLKQTTADKNDPKIKENLLNRNFTLSYPNQVWVGDISEIKTTQGKPYLAYYLDLYSRKIVG